MTRAQLEPIVRAAGAITDESVILVLGSQSILGAFPSAPSPLDVSREADVCPMHAPEKAVDPAGFFAALRLTYADPEPHHSGPHRIA